MRLRPDPACTSLFMPGISRSGLPLHGTLGCVMCQQREGCAMERYCDTPL